jgi:putative Mg2+ transporter-C (MgtC) family protein
MKLFGTARLKNRKRCGGGMTINVYWQQVALRLVCALLAGVVVGINRDEKGRPAGIRTNVLVAIAACVAMIQANSLLGSRGKPQDSFVVLDLMRLPLGILSGMGFIGAGVILRKGDIVLGVTTAASLWMITVLGLCIDRGQIGLGLAGLGLAAGTLWGLKYLEKALPHDHRGMLSVSFDQTVMSEREIRTHVHRSICRIDSWGFSASRAGTTQQIESEVRWRTKRQDPFPPPIVEELACLPGVLTVDWKA